MKLFTTHAVTRTITQKALLLFSTVICIALIPTTAAASKNSIHIDVPGFSIGLHDNHYRNNRHSNRGYKDRHHRSNRNYYGHSTRHNRYYDRGYNNRGYYPRNYYSRGYYSQNNGYRNYSYPRDNRYYYRPRSNYYGNVYKNSTCLRAGFSLNFYENSDCSPHKDHFHCN